MVATDPSLHKRGAVGVCAAGTATGAPGAALGEVDDVRVGVVVGATTAGVDVVGTGVGVGVETATGADEAGAGVGADAFGSATPPCATPPWPEHVPRPSDLLHVPSLHVDPAWATGAHARTATSETTTDAMIRRTIPPVTHL